MQFILASASPRRRELLEMLGVGPLLVRPSGVVEENYPDLTPEELVVRLAQNKGEAILPAAGQEDIVISADTIVVLNGEILGKPKDEEDAFRMLSSLSGNTHLVHTGIALLSHEKVETAVVSSRVTFRELTSQEIWDYIHSGEPMDKAGAYGIQGLGSLFVSHLDGDFFAVMGFPVCRFAELMSSFGVEILSLRRQF
ncbi:MAG: septum formation inhibitor Maf [Clostridia bacterium]|nr:septum formation inhibitor Maf [Clostridia bacterium]